LEGRRLRNFFIRKKSPRDEKKAVATKETHIQPSFASNLLPRRKGTPYLISPPGEKRRPSGGRKKSVGGRTCLPLQEKRKSSTFLQRELTPDHKEDQHVIGFEKRKEEKQFRGKDHYSDPPGGSCSQRKRGKSSIPTKHTGQTAHIHQRDETALWPGGL